MQALESVVLVQIDAEKGEGVDLAKEYFVKGYPTFVLANAEGAVLDTWSGYDKNGFLGTHAVAVADPTTIEQKRERFEYAPTAKDASALARFHGTRGEYEKAVELAQRAAVMEPSAETRYAVFDYMAYGHMKTEAFDLKEVQGAAQQVLTSEGVEPAKIVVDPAFPNRQGGCDLFTQIGPGSGHVLEGSE